MDPAVELSLLQARFPDVQISDYGKLLFGQFPYCYGNKFIGCEGNEGHNTITGGDQESGMCS